MALGPSGPTVFRLYDIFNYYFDISDYVLLLFSGFVFFLSPDELSLIPASVVYWFSLFSSGPVASAVRRVSL